MKPGGFILRYEPFGAIVSTENPPALTFVDKEFVRRLGRGGSPLWKKPWDGLLSAPVEAHYALTRYCPVGCPGCYMDATADAGLLESSESSKSSDVALDTADRLSRMGVFHVALGGGESFLSPRLFEVARRLRDRGVVPNVTTSGHGVSEDAAERCKVFGQVNVSLDGVGGEDRGLTRPPGHFETADGALRRLASHGVRVGINCVITRRNYGRLEEILAYARRRGVRDVELLRMKPTGRGREIYRETALTPEQGVELLPRLKKLARRFRVSLKLDCSFTPFICCHRPPRKVLDFFCVLGCDAGNWLVGVDPSGEVSPCSFAPGGTIGIEEMEKGWDGPETFAEHRRWDRDTASFCRRCDYLTLCKGGCHAVAHYLTGSIREPDPECPLVLRGRV